MNDTKPARVTFARINAALAKEFGEGQVELVLASSGYLYFAGPLAAAGMTESGVYGTNTIGHTPVDEWVAIARGKLKYQPTDS